MGSTFEAGARFLQWWASLDTRWQRRCYMDIRGTWEEFNGHDLHCTEDFEGKRMSMVYCTRGFDQGFDQGSHVLQALPSDASINFSKVWYPVPGLERGREGRTVYWRDRVCQAMMYIYTYVRETWQGMAGLHDKTSMHTRARGENCILAWQGMSGHDVTIYIYICTCTSIEPYRTTPSFLYATT